MFNEFQVASALKSSKNADGISNNIFLDSGVTICTIVNRLKGIHLGSLDEAIKEVIHCPPNMEQFQKWKGESLSKRFQFYFSCSLWFKAGCIELLDSRGLSLSFAALFAPNGQVGIIASIADETRYIIEP